MPAIRHILVAVGALDAKSLPAVHKAAQMARACGARLELYHGLDAPVYGDLGGLGDGGLAGLEKDLQRRAIVRLQAMGDRLRRYRIKVSVAAEWDFPAYEAVVRRPPLPDCTRPRRCNRVPRAARGARVMSSVPSDSLGFY